MWKATLKDKPKKAKSQSPARCHQCQQSLAGKTQYFDKDSNGKYFAVYCEKCNYKRS